MNGYLDDDLYKTVTENIPIICVDIIPIKKDENWKVGLIVRATGTQAKKWTILGGRIYHSESVDEAIGRHLKHDLGVENFNHFKDFSDQNPFMVQQYFMKDNFESDRYGFDPSKHSLALTYLVQIDESQLTPRNEAEDFVWIEDQITDASQTGYNQHVMVNRALEALKTA